MPLWVANVACALTGLDAGLDAFDDRARAPLRQLGPNVTDRVSKAIANDAVWVIGVLLIDALAQITLAEHLLSIGSVIRGRARFAWRGTKAIGFVRRDGREWNGDQGLRSSFSPKFQ